MRINKGIVIILIAVAYLVFAQMNGFIDWFAYLLAGIGASQLGQYWDTKKEENGNKSGRK